VPRNRVFRASTSLQTADRVKNPVSKRRSASKTELALYKKVHEKADEFHSQATREALLELSQQAVISRALNYFLRK
jgi:hypothetical protein